MLYHHFHQSSLHWCSSVRTCPSVFLLKVFQLELCAFLICFVNLTRSVHFIVMIRTLRAVTQK